MNLSELPCKLTIHEISSREIDVGEFRVCSALVCHPGPTVGYRISAPKKGILTYLPDHEPALAALRFPSLPREWTSGGALAAGADLLIHDGQYSAAEYPGHCGWGRSSLNQTLESDTGRRGKHRRISWVAAPSAVRVIQINGFNLNHLGHWFKLDLPSRTP